MANAAASTTPTSIASASRPSPESACRRSGCREQARVRGAGSASAARHGGQNPQMLNDRLFRSKLPEVRNRMMPPIGRSAWPDPARRLAGVAASRPSGNAMSICGRRESSRAEGGHLADPCFGPIREPMTVAAQPPASPARTQPRARRRDSTTRDGEDENRRRSTRRGSRRRQDASKGRRERGIPRRRRPIARDSDAKPARPRAPTQIHRW